MYSLSLNLAQRYFNTNELRLRIETCTRQKCARYYNSTMSVVI